MATARLRKTFHYPADDDDEPADLDEEGTAKAKITRCGVILMQSPRAGEADRQAQSAG